MNAPIRHSAAPDALPRDGALLVDYLARDRAFRDIGPKRAQALHDALGANLLEHLAMATNEVIDLVGEEPALCAAAALAERQGEADLLAWLSSLRVEMPIGRAIRLARAWGPQGLAALKTNPYLLLTIADWKVVDRVARAAGIGTDDQRRDAAAVEAALQGRAGLRSGSTCVSRANIRLEAGKLLGRPLTPDAVGRAIAIGGAIPIGDDLQPPGAAWMEAETAQILSALARERPSQDLALAKLSDQEISDLLDHCADDQGFPFTDKQREAVHAAHKHRALVLGGYAGSGKTTVLRGICATLEASGRHPVIVTLSGRAAQRATEATGRPAMTVAKFLVMNDRDDRHLTAADVLIADEASMLSLVEVWRLLRRLGDASLILCGDPAQLPPIGFGLVFHALVDEVATPKVILDRVHRQSEESGIPSIAEMIRDGALPDLPDFASGMGVTFTPCSREGLLDAIKKIGVSLRRDGVTRDQMKIIAPTNREIDVINQHFHNIRLRQGGPSWPGLPALMPGEPIIWTRNDPDRGLTNGSMGRVLDAGETNARVCLDDRRIDLTCDDRQHIRLAYAISVHKAQGSQWPVIIVPAFRSKVMDRSMVYTALTRAQGRAIFLGDRSALRTATFDPDAVAWRRTGFARWMAVSSSN